MTQSLKIEFFHDVICSFCFPMSYRMRLIEKKYPQIEIIHRSFALAPNDRAFERMFGSRQSAKDQILDHWQSANQNDDLHRFNIAGMRNADFPFPASIKPLLACKAAYVVAGNSGYWDLFDALQSALFVDSQNIELLDCIESCVIACDLNLTEWRQAFNHENTLALLQQDFTLAQQYGLTSVPALVIDQQYKVNGAVSLENIESVITQISSLKPASALSASGQCRLEDGGMNCK